MTHHIQDLHLHFHLPLPKTDLRFALVAVIAFDVCSDDNWSCPHPTQTIADFVPKIMMDPTTPLSPIRASTLPIEEGPSQPCSADVGKEMAKGMAGMPGGPTGSNDAGAAAGECWVSAVLSNGPVNVAVSFTMVRLSAGVKLVTI